MLNQLANANLILSDLLFEVNNTMFQIDSLLIKRDTLFLFEFELNEMEADHITPWHEGGKTTLIIAKCYVERIIGENREIKNPY